MDPTKMATAASLGDGGVIEKHRPNDKEVAESPARDARTHRSSP